MQELAFLAGLVRVGAFDKDELMDVLHVLFPNKTKEEIQKVFSHITNEAQEQRPGDQEV